MDKLFESLPMGFYPSSATMTFKAFKRIPGSFIHLLLPETMFYSLQFYNVSGLSSHKKSTPRRFWTIGVGTSTSSWRVYPNCFCFYYSPVLRLLLTLPQHERQVNGGLGVPWDQWTKSPAVNSVQCTNRNFYCRIQLFTVVK